MTSARHALGQAAGLSAFLWGYPLIESLRTCRLQASPQPGETPQWASPIDHLHHVTHAACARDRDVVTPSNDLLYTTGWINLATGAKLLHVPASRNHGGRYFVLALYDAWTNNFENPGSRTSPPDGETLLLCGPDTPRGGGVPEGVRIVESPTNLVWLLARVLTGPGDDILAARCLQADITLESLDSERNSRPPAVTLQWRGSAAQDTIAALHHRPESADAIADDFFQNLCRALAEEHCPAADEGLFALIGHAGLKAEAEFDPSVLDAETLAGLRAGLQQGVALISTASYSPRARPWIPNFNIGRYGTRYGVRANVAYRGLGALAPDEAIYAIGDFDVRGQPLDGGTPYAMRFEAGDEPPVDAFWSITLYDDDRFLYGNDSERHAIGDRTADLQRDADGSLTLHISHTAPTDTRNWLPAPAGRFYLVLRMYAPRPQVRQWRIPALTPVAPSEPLPHG